MTGTMALMEWEFTEGPGNEGQFLATGKVIETLRRHLAKNEIDEAVTLYETCVQETVGEELWQEFVSASTPTRKAIANLFYRSRDYQRAGEACEQLGEWPAAARAYAAAYNWSKAAECLSKAGEPMRAAKMYEKGGEPRRAAELYFEAEQYPQAAEALELSGDLVGAGQLFVRAGEPARAAQALSRVSPQDARFMQALALLADVLKTLNRRDLAIQRLSAVLKGSTALRTPAEADVAYRLGLLLAEDGRLVEAQPVFERIRAYDPSYRDVATRLQAIADGSSSRAAMPADGSAAGPPADLARRGSFPAEPVPLVKPRSGRSRGGSAGPADYVQRMAGYDVLKKLQIFEDLSLDEMRAFYLICERTVYRPNEVIIEQGHPGPGLVIVREGSLRVTRVESGGSETELAVIPAGQYVGEMSLVDEAPTSARVIAAEPVKALWVAKPRFEQFMIGHEAVATRIYRSFLRTLSMRLREQNLRTG